MPHIGYHEIADIIAERIRKEAYAPGSKLPPERMMADEFGVERTTLRRALSLLIDRGLIQKKTGIGSFVRESMAAAPLISFVSTSDSAPDGISAINHHFLTPVFNALAELCSVDGYRTISMMLTGANALESLEAVLDTSTAIVLADNVPAAFIRRARASGVPCVLMSERARGFRSVLCDNEQGIRQTVQHLLSLGHQNIAFLGGDEVFYNATARADSYRNTMHHLLPHVKPIVELCGWTAQRGYRAGRAFLERHREVTAICAVNDSVAIGIYQAAAELGLRVPQDLSIAGFGASEEAVAARIPLTTVRVSHERFARELYRALRSELAHPYEDPAAILVETEMIVNHTTGKSGS